MSMLQNYDLENVLSTGIQDHIISGLKVQSIASAFSYLSTAQLLYIVFAGGSIVLGFLPWYSWFVGLFSIPIAIFDIWAAASSIASLYMLALAIPALFQLYTLPIFLFIAIFGEIFLIPLIPFTPFLFVGGVIGWIIGDI